MAEVAAKQREDDAAADSPVAAPVAAPASTPAAPPEDETDRALREFEAAISKPDQQPADQPGAQPATGAAAPQDELDKLLDELSRPGQFDNSLFTPRTSDPQQAAEQQQLATLQNENAQLRGAIQAAADRQDFDKLTSELQGRLPPHLPDDYARTQLIAMSAEKPELVAAFDYRNVNRQAVNQELTRVEQVLAQLQRNPNGADPQQIAQLTQYGFKLGVMLNSREILRRAVREVERRGRSFHQIDEIASADHAAVVFAMRGTSGKIQPEPPPNFGQMSDKEFNRWTRNNLGF